MASCLIGRWQEKGRELIYLLLDQKGLELLQPWVRYNEVESKIDKYKGDVDKEAIGLAKEFKKFQEEGIEFLKKYL